MVGAYASLGLIAESRSQSTLAQEWNIRAVALSNDFPLCLPARRRTLSLGSPANVAFLRCRRPGAKSPESRYRRQYSATRYSSGLRRSAAPAEPAPDEAAQREIAACDAKLRQHRVALEAGAAPVLVTSWIAETQARRTVAEARLRKPTGRRRMTETRSRVS